MTLLGRQLPRLPIRPASGEVATRRDIAEVGTEVRAVKAELPKWMFAQFLGQVGLIVALFLVLRSG